MKDSLSSSGHNILTSVVEGHSQQLHHSVVSTVEWRIGEMFHTRKKSSSNSMIYQIMCGSCDASYYSETNWQLGTKIEEHCIVRHHHISSVLVEHVDKAENLPN